MDLESLYAQQTAGIQKGNTGASGGMASGAVSGKPIPAQTRIVQPGVLPAVLQKAADVGKQALNIDAAIAGKSVRYVEHTAIDVAKQTLGASRTAVEIQTQPIFDYMNDRTTKMLDQRQQNVQRAYKSGQMSKENYLKATAALNEAFTKLSKNTQTISNGTTPRQRASDFVNTAINAISLGSFTTEEALGKEATNTVVSRLEDAVTKIPAVKALAERNAASIIKAGANETFDQVLATYAKKVAIGLLIKRPIFYQSNIQGGKQIYSDIIKGNYTDAAKQSAWLATQMLEGGPIGTFFKGAGWLKKVLGDLSYGRGSFIDGISQQIGNKNPSQIARFLASLQQKSPQEFEKANQVFKILQETNLQANSEDVQRAVDSVLAHYQQHGIPLENVTPSQLYKDFSNWSKADDLAQKTLRAGLVKGVNPEDAQKYVVVRWDNPTKQAVADAVKKAGPEMQDRLAAVRALSDQPGVGWGNNALLMSRIEAIINNAALDKATSAEAAAKGIKEITTASTILSDVPKKVSQELADLGYSIAQPAGNRRLAPVGQDNLRNLVTGAVRGDSDVFDAARAPNPGMAALSGAIDKMGLSLRSTNEVATRKLSESVVANLDELGMGTSLGLKNTQGGDVINGGRAILSKLQQYIENKRPVLGIARQTALTDIRQLRVGEVADALHVSKGDARQISKAIMHGYMQVPLELRGLGPKVVDGLYAINPLHKYYARIQSALRYTYNPFFQVRADVKTRFVAHAEANNLLWGKSRATLDEGARVLDRAGILSSSLPAEAAQDQVLGRITANLTGSQRRQVAGLAYDLAEHRGITIDQLANQHANEVEDILRTVVQYPRHGVLASPLARTIDMIFFPLRFDAKVTLVAAKALAKQPPSVQLAVLHSGFKLKNWLQSDEGIKWQSTHADAIQLFNWLSPSGAISHTLGLLGHKPDSIASVGELGGLPLGFISQILDGQGIIHLNRPYVDPKTGDVFPDSVPETTKARAATALVDLLNTMFTYPGKTVGLPGKNASVKKLVDDFINTNGSDFDKQIRTDALTPAQKNMIRVLKGDTSDNAINSLYHSPAPGQFDWYTLPPLTLPYKVTAPTSPKPTLVKRTGLPSRAKGKKAKNLAIPITQGTQPLP